MARQEMELIYIASRLSPQPGVDKADACIDYLYNLKQSYKAAVPVWRKGHYPIVPGADFLVYLELDGDYGKMGRYPYQGSLKLLSACDSILIVNGLQEMNMVDSEGVAVELLQAQRTNQKVYWDIDEIIPVGGEI